MKKRKALLFIILLLFVSLSTSGKMIAYAENESAEGCRLMLDYNYLEDEMTEVVLSLSSSNGVCALLGEIEYDENAYLLLSCGAEGEIFDFKYADIGDSVRFLLDSTENSEPEGILARFYFKKVGEGEKKSFLLKCEKGGIIYLDKKSDPVPYVSVDMTDSESKNETEREEDTPPVLQRTEKNGTSLSFSVKADKNCFAAGVRLFCVDLSGEGKHFEAQILGVVNENGEFKGKYVFCDDAEYTVIISAVGYKRDGRAPGEKEVIFINGKQKD